MSTSNHKARIRYTRQFREQVVERVRAGRPIPELAQQYGCTAATIRNWVRLARQQERRPWSVGELTLAERSELERLRRENRQLLMEREILSKAAAWFTQDSHPGSKRSSDS